MYMYILPLLRVSLIALQISNAFAEGEFRCMSPCACGHSYLSDLPISAHWHDKDVAAYPIAHGNEATYTDEEGPKGDLMTIAMCILQEGTDPGALIASLPKDIQLLTILLGRGSGEMTIKADALHDFHRLIVLDIQGLPNDTNKHKDQLTLCSDALYPLTSLQYLNLQHIRLMMCKDYDNSISPVVASTTNGRLTFLEPESNEIPLVPYKEYRKVLQQEGVASFARLSNLLFLRVFHCNLQELHWKMFKGCDKLQHLSLEHNNLLFIPHFVFYGTPRLLTLSLAGNKLLGLQVTALAGLLELQKLDLSRNNFTHLSELSLPPFPELRVADFRYNPMLLVYPSTFEIMNATFTLYLGGDGSELHLQPNSFLGLSSLKKLVILQAKVPLLKRELFTGMPKLTKLQITGDLTEISFDSFLEVPKLEELLLSNCTISSISMDAFYGLYSLISLDLSNNQLTTLPPGVFDQQFSLRELRLQSNKLTQLPVGMFKHVPAKMIRLNNNPWHCSCDMRDWQPAAINKIPQISISTCRFAYGKGSMCKKTNAIKRYVYDKRVAPRCATPDKYKDWNVFHLLRKELNCNAESKKNDKKTYIQKKYEEYVSNTSIKPQPSQSKSEKLAVILEGTVQDQKPSSVPTSAIQSLNKTATQLTHTQKLRKIDAGHEELISKVVESNIQSKKVTKLEIHLEKLEKTKQKEIKVEVENKLNADAIANRKEDNGKTSKIAWKNDMAKKRQEKLKRIQI